MRIKKKYLGFMALHNPKDQILEFYFIFSQNIAFLSSKNAKNGILALFDHKNHRDPKNLRCEGVNASFFNFQPKI
jgi:hypothetical protein